MYYKPSSHWKGRLEDNMDIAIHITLLKMKYSYCTEQISQNRHGKFD